MPSYFLVAALAVTVLTRTAPSVAAAPAERIFRGGPIVTVDPARPTAEAGLEHFRLETTETPAVPEGHVRVAVHYLSLDPYMRMRMNDAKSYAAPVGIGEVMIGGTVGVVAE
jgi:hypothetical protein